jgi:enamine deaminase RidA (YjgF/YER057c/UK114 family)
MGDRMRDVISAPAPGLDLGREYGHHQSPAIRAGGLIFCSGMVAISPKTGEREQRHGDQRSAAHFRKSETASGIGGVVLGPHRAGPLR